MTGMWKKADVMGSGGLFSGPSGRKEFCRHVLENLVSPSHHCTWTECKPGCWSYGSWEGKCPSQCPHPRSDELIGERHVCRENLGNQSATQMPLLHLAIGDKIISHQFFKTTSIFTKELSKQRAMCTEAGVERQLAASLTYLFSSGALFVLEPRDGPVSVREQPGEEACKNVSGHQCWQGVCSH